MVKAILQWFQNLINGVKTVINGIKAVFSGFAGAIKTFTGYFVTGISTIINYFRDLPGKIKGALANAATWLYSVGQNVMEGFLNGLASLGGRVLDKARSIADGVKNAVKGALGIASPSKVFMGYGKNVVQGFINGISGESRALTNSLNMFSDQPRFQQMNGSPSEPLVGSPSSAGLQIENYYANDQVDPWRQAEDWYFIVTSRGGY
jgi:phage-related minor tail protein